MAKIRHDPGFGGRTSRSAKARQIDAPTTPTPYPIAATMPQTSPWMMPLRGSRDGVNDRQANATAVHAPGRV